MRTLKHHEHKLLKKVNFLEWKREHNVRENSILRRFHIQRREDYLEYNKLCGQIEKVVLRLKALKPEDPYRIETTERLLDKLFEMGVIKSKKSLNACDKMTASAFCRRRLPVVMVRMKMAQNLKEAVTFVEHGHVRVGPEVVTDPAFMVTRKYEDFVTWVDSSKIKKTILKFHDQLDDFDLLDI
eukprot:TRINITY_DN4057_c0_g1_i1.p1 TRINITY_DN4057_c0_g1~~TRINITY_DN4057_c0_g1_i1.p1  ORF type:complete len:184 (-),score=86.58 TRINITY_DN4057_c0_g1_i1:89-640(-)